MSENNKPRLAEVLGVEVNEKFDFVGGGFTHCCYVDSNGWLRDENDNMCDTHAVFLINNPQYMRRRPRWTEQEVEDAKTFRRMWPDGEIEFDRWPDGRCCLAQIRGGLNGCLDLGEVDLFPSVKPGQTVKLDDIIGGNE